MTKKEDVLAKKENLKNDPYRHMMSVLFCKWKPYIIRGIFSTKDEPTYFSTFLKKLPITQKELSRNLKELESDGFVCRIVIPTVPPRVEYRLTDIGQSLIPLLDLVYDMGWKDMKYKNLTIDKFGEKIHGYSDKV